MAKKIQDKRWRSKPRRKPRYNFGRIQLAMYKRGQYDNSDRPFKVINRTRYFIKH